MDINAVCEKREQAEILAGISGIGHIFHPGNTMPYVFRNENASRCRGFLSEPDLLIRNPDEIGFLKENGYSILDVDERTYDASPSDHGEILFSRPWIGDPYHPESVTYVIYHIPADVYEMEYESIIPLDP